MSLSTPSNVWQIAYASEDSHGNPEMATATIVVPQSPWIPGARPAVAYEVAEDATGSQCEPSYMMATTDSPGLDIDLNSMLAMGWAQVIPDYEGPKSAWLAGPGEGHVVLDGIRAARSFVPAGLDHSPWALDGYSGGANGAGWAAQLQPTYAPDVHLVGVAIGGTPADPAAVAAYIDGGLFSGFEAAAAWGIWQDYPEMDLSSIVNASGAQALTQVGGQCLVSLLVDYAFKTLASYSTLSDPLSYPPLAAVLKEDTLGQSKPTTAPIYDYHGELDEIVPVAQDDTLVSNWCKDGATVDEVRDLFAEHVLEFLEEDGNVLNFLAARFAGEPATNTC